MAENGFDTQDVEINPQYVEAFINACDVFLKKIDSDQDFTLDDLVNTRAVLNDCMHALEWSEETDKLIKACLKKCDALITTKKES